MRVRCVVLGLGLGLGLPACLDELPDVQRVEGTRLLGVRATLAQSMVAPHEAGVAEFVPGDAVILRTHLVDVDGAIDPATVPSRWIACSVAPSLPAFSCLVEAQPLDGDNVGACLPGEAQAPVSLERPCRLANLHEPTFVVPYFARASAGFDLELTGVFQLGDTPVATCETALLAGDFDTPDDCLYVSYPLRMVAAAIPDNPSPVSDVDRHPATGRLRVVVGSEDEGSQRTEMIDPGGELAMRLDERLELFAEPPPEARQRFVVPINNGETFESREESLLGRWYATSGTYEERDPGLESLTSEGLEFDWVPDVRGRTRLYFVLRDGRAGTSWLSFDAVVE
ncbi:MAG: hypothetical protein B7733_00205 [Myxococcales bacterium FL481]|nr:MAG: hypothetical protein B7733_00205 [Myxococcales bacterium FL481]